MFLSGGDKGAFSDALEFGPGKTVGRGGGVVSGIVGAVIFGLLNKVGLRECRCSGESRLGDL